MYLQDQEEYDCIDLYSRTKSNTRINNRPQNKFTHLIDNDNDNNETLFNHPTLELKDSDNVLKTLNNNNHIDNCSTDVE